MSRRPLHGLPCLIARQAPRPRRPTWRRCAHHFHGPMPAMSPSRLACAEHGAGGVHVGLPSEDSNVPSGCRWPLAPISASRSPLSRSPPSASTQRADVADQEADAHAGTMGGSGQIDPKTGQMGGSGHLAHKFKNRNSTSQANLVAGLGSGGLRYKNLPTSESAPPQMFPFPRAGPEKRSWRSRCGPVQSSPVDRLLTLSLSFFI
jgi:hypothetical protein